MVAAVTIKTDATETSIKIITLETTSTRAKPITSMKTLAAQVVLEVGLSQRTLPYGSTPQLPGLVVIMGDLCGYTKF